MQNTHEEGLDKSNSQVKLTYLTFPRSPESHGMGEKRHYPLFCSSYLSNFPLSSSDAVETRSAMGRYLWELGDGYIETYYSLLLCVIATGYITHTPL